MGKFISQTFYNIVFLKMRNTDSKNTRLKVTDFAARFSPACNYIPPEILDC